MFKCLNVLLNAIGNQFLHFDLQSLTNILSMPFDDNNKISLNFPFPNLLKAKTNKQTTQQQQ